VQNSEVKEILAPLNVESGNVTCGNIFDRHTTSVRSDFQGSKITTKWTREIYIYFPLYGDK
jgi:hypothetical protein